jgi:hypothetical protein
MERTKEGGKVIMSIEELNTRVIPKDPFTFERTMEAWEKGDIEEVLMWLGDERRMGFVADNWYVLQEKGFYEKALLKAHAGIRINYAHWGIDVLRFLFRVADIEKLRRAGDPIPDKSTFTLYRGVSGKTRKRRVNSFSWTESPNIAAWFATRFKGCGIGDPAVFTITVPNESIMAHILDRNEAEYLVKLPLPTKPKRLKELPEALLPKIHLLRRRISSACMAAKKGNGYGS